MKLKTYLKKLNATDIVSIGTRDGRGYIYIGEAGNVDQIVQEFERYRDDRIEELAAVQAKLIVLARETPADGIDSVFEYAAMISRLKARLERLNEYIYHYVDVLKRDVCDESERIDEDGVRVIITGLENGEYWFKSEYDKHKRKG